MIGRELMRRDKKKLYNKKSLNLVAFILLGVAFAIILLDVGYEKILLSKLREETVRNVLCYQEDLNLLVRNELFTYEERFIVAEEANEYSIEYSALANETLNKIFEEMQLEEISIGILRSENNMEKPFVFFSIRNTVPQIKNIEYGFYYTETDKPTGYMDIVNYEGNDLVSSFWGINYRYKTKKIKDNWWYYEMVIRDA